MLHQIRVEVAKADNCYNVYSNEIPGVLATGETSEEAIEKYILMASRYLNDLLFEGKKLPEMPITKIIDVSING